MNRSTDLGRASAWMALGTIVSRITGLLRSILLVTILGTGLNADLFEVANTIPNSMYFLVAGGIFNVVLLPQIVRAMLNHEDGGDAYVQRIMTLGLVVLAVASVVLTLAVPLLMHVLYQQTLFTDELAAQRESALLLMVLCMPQVFFYGAFVLVGQILNAKHRFGPMMWAPILNNLVAITMLGSYAFLFGTDAIGTEGFTTRQALVLGLGSTLGIVLQAAVLVPFLRSVGFRFRPRFDFRGVGLGHTLRLGAWTLGYILINQIAMIIIVRLASGATIEGGATGQDAAGITVYNLGYLISQAPHGVITVSLATAMLPTLSALSSAGKRGRFRAEFSRTIRVIALLMAPIAVLIGLLGQQIAEVLLFLRSSASNVDAVGSTIAAFSLGLFMFSLSYFLLRGFYAAEDTKTPFFIQAIVATTNVSLAWWLTHDAPPIEVSTRLAWSFGIATTVGVIVAGWLLGRHTGRLLDHEMVRFFVRLSIALVLTGAAAWAVAHFTSFPALVELTTASLAGLIAFLGAARTMRITELSLVMRVVSRRTPGGSDA